MSKAKIVVLGGGYAGLMTVTKLQSKLQLDEADITLVNKHDYHYETTWLHEASAGTIEYDAARYGIKSVLKKIKQLDGFLIGSASINPIKFIEIIEKILLFLLYHFPYIFPPFFLNAIF